VTGGVSFGFREDWWIGWESNFESRSELDEMTAALFNPTPSLSTMIINHYNLKGNITSYNLGGMGCSAGLISIDLAKDLLQVHRNSYANVVSMENITLNWTQPLPVIHDENAKINKGFLAGKAGAAKLGGLKVQQPDLSDRITLSNITNRLKPLPNLGTASPNAVHKESVQAGAEKTDNGKG
ncbi:hypothetical protein KI387_012541, partial [Taxus chinensis]